jgi:hypothetical protein
MNPEDFPFRESKTVSGGMADLSTLYDPMTLDVDDVALIEDEDGSAQLNRLSRLAKTVETHIAMREMMQYGETMKPLFSTVDTMIESATQVALVMRRGAVIVVSLSVATVYECCVPGKTASEATASHATETSQVARAVIVIRTFQSHVSTIVAVNTRRVREGSEVC